MSERSLGHSSAPSELRRSGKRTFDRPYPRTDLPIREYDVTPDGRRFLLLHEDRPPIKVTEMILVQNWVEELKKRVPTK